MFVTTPTPTPTPEPTTTTDPFVDETTTTSTTSSSTTTSLPWTGLEQSISDGFGMIGVLLIAFLIVWVFKAIRSPAIQS